MNNFTEITETLKIKLSLSSDKELAEALSMKSQAFSERKRTNSIPHKDILQLCDTENLDLNEIYYSKIENKCSNINYKEEVLKSFDNLTDKQIQYIYHVTKAEELKNN